MNEDRVLTSEKKRIGVTAKLLALYFVLMPLDSIDVFGMGSLLRVIALFPIASIIFLNRKSKIRLNGMSKWALLYTASIVVSCIYSISFSDSLNSARRLLINMALILCVGSMYDEYNRSEYIFLMKALVLGGVANIILTFLNPETTSRTGRLTLSIADSTQDMNYINGYMLFALAFFMKKLIKDKKLYALAPVVVIFVFTLMTGSRGSLLALAAIVISTILYIFFVDRNIKPGTILVTIIVVVLFLLFYDRLLMLIAPQVAERFSFKFIQNYRGVNRTDLWIYILNKFMDADMFRHILGLGTGTVYIVNDFTHQVAHNLWLDHLVANGIVGLIIFTGMQVCFLKAALRSQDVVLITSYIGFLAMCLTLSLVSYKPIWNCMMMIMIASQIKEKSETALDY